MYVFTKKVVMRSFLIGLHRGDWRGKKQETNWFRDLIRSQHNYPFPPKKRVAQMEREPDQTHPCFCWNVLRNKFANGSKFTMTPCATKKSVMSTIFLTSTHSIILLGRVGCLVGKREKRKGSGKRIRERNTLWVCAVMPSPSPYPNMVDIDPEKRKPLTPNSLNNITPASRNSRSSDMFFF